jgi:ABC-2 type transport system ATP-binding protein
MRVAENMGEKAILQVEEVTKRYNGTVAVDRVSFAVHPGEILGYLGPNGAGKTTTIRMILGIIEPDQGRILFPENPDGELRKEQVGYLPEERGLYGDARVLDLLVYLAGLKGMASGEARREALSWLSRFDLGEWAHKKVEQLSKGMQQKVQFLAAIIHRPQFLVLDEPVAGLDPVNQDLVQSLIRELAQGGTAVLLSSHQMNLVEELCDRIFLIHRGKQVLYGKLAEIQAGFGEDFVTIRFRGNGELLKKTGALVGLRIEGDRAEGRLPPGTEPEAFLRSLPEGLGIREISIRKPPLHEIFVAIVGESEQ